MEVTLACMSRLRYMSVCSLQMLSSLAKLLMPSTRVEKAFIGRLQNEPEFCCIHRVRGGVGAWPPASSSTWAPTCRVHLPGNLPLLHPKEGTRKAPPELPKTPLLHLGRCHLALVLECRLVLVQPARTFLLQVQLPENQEWMSDLICCTARVCGRRGTLDSPAIW